MAKWWVNDPNGASVHYPTKARAQKTARQVKGAFVSKGNAVGGKHRGGCMSMVLAVLGMVAAIIGICFS